MHQGRPRGAGNKLEQCKWWLLQQLKAYPEAMALYHVQCGREKGFSRSTIYNAAKALGVIKAPFYGGGGVGKWPVKVSQWMVFGNPAVSLNAPVTEPTFQPKTSADRVEKFRQDPAKRARERDQDRLRRAAARATPGF
jgi:hypothetical protein